MMLWRSSKKFFFSLEKVDISYLQSNHHQLQFIQQMLKLCPLKILICDMPLNCIIYIQRRNKTVDIFKILGIISDFFWLLLPENNISIKHLKFDIIGLPQIYLLLGFKNKDEWNYLWL